MFHTLASVFSRGRGSHVDIQNRDTGLKSRISSVRVGACSSQREQITLHDFYGKSRGDRPAMWHSNANSYDNTLLYEREIIEL